MTPLYSVLAVLILTYCFLSFTVILTLSSKYKYYKLTYQLLYSGNYIYSTENNMYIRFTKPNQDKITNDK